MDEYNCLALLTVAYQFRFACERYRDDHPDVFASMRRFPHNCCTLASEAFLRYLREEHIGEGELLNFRRKPSDFMSNHDLVFIHGWTIDLTGDQFRNERRPIIIRRLSALPKSWTLLHRFTLDQLATRRTDPVLIKMYQDIRSFLPASSKLPTLRQAAINSVRDL